MAVGAKEHSKRARRSTRFTRLIPLLPIMLVVVGVSLTGAQLFRSALAEDGKPVRRGEAVFQFNCRLSHQAPDDPIVFPGDDGAAHMHDFWGNTTTNADSTTDSLTEGGSSCPLEPLDKAAYWQPSIGVRDARGDIEWLKPNPSLPYYEYGGTDDTPEVQAFPLGLRMIAGDSKSVEPLNTEFLYWQCVDANGGEDEGRVKGPKEGQIPVCDPGFHVTAAIDFPDCWDGIWLYPQNPKDYQHMVYSGGKPDGGGTDCPESHPVKLPQLHFRMHWNDFQGSRDAFLSSDLTLPTGERNQGRSLHADFWNAWDEGRLKKLVEVCLNSGDGCNTGDEIPEGTLPPPYPKGKEPHKLGDADDDRKVNGVDLSLLIAHFGDDYPPADFNGDDVVNGRDQDILLNHWTW